MPQGILSSFIQLCCQTNDVAYISILLSYLLFPPFEQMLYNQIKFELSVLKGAKDELTPYSENYILLLEDFGF